MISGSMPPYVFGSGAIRALPDLLKKRRPGWVLWLVDHFFSFGSDCPFPVRSGDTMFSVDTTFEPTVESVDAIVVSMREKLVEHGTYDPPRAVVGIGGGSTMDTAKAVSILLTNPGKAADYQGWDLVKEPTVYKIGVPTISGTGSESSSTCVLTNHEKGLKLGMNSPFSRFDQVVLDPDLTATVPREQYFHSGMDTWCHCAEYTMGADHDAMTDALVQQAINMCRGVFGGFVNHNEPDEDLAVRGMQCDSARASLMVASYLGGSSAARTGLIHPFSAGLGTVLGVRHGLANCVAVEALRDWYPAWRQSFHALRESCGIELPTGLCDGLDYDQMERLYQSTVIHEKPLRNALGDGWRDVLTREKVYEIFRRM